MAVFPPTDWGAWTPEEYQVGAPGTALHFERWFRNVVAAFQGAVGAPRVRPSALQAPGVISGDLNGTTYVAFTGLDGIKQIRFDFNTRSNTGITTLFQASFSNDAGASWGGNQDITTSAAQVTLATAAGMMDLQTGVFATSGVAYNPTGPTSVAASLTGTLTVPANCNAVRFRATVAGIFGLIIITPIGGRE